MREIILAYAIKYHGDVHRMRLAIENEEPVQLVEYQGQYITIVDELYPRRLLLLDVPPLILFYKGDIRLLETNCLCVIGSRKIQDTSMRYCECLIENVQPYTIVSGVAKGMDALAHQCAIKRGLKCIGVIGCGLDVVYPKENGELYQLLEEHLMLSEYPFGVAPYAHHFVARNRILAGLSEKCVVVQAKKRSGTMITVSYALDLGVDIYAFPYRMEDTFSDGCNELIQQGANMILSISDIQKL